MQIPLNQEPSILEVENSFDEWWRAASKWEKVRSPIRPSVEERLSALEEATLELILGEGEVEVEKMIEFLALQVIMEKISIEVVPVIYRERVEKRVEEFLDKEKAGY